MDKVAIVTGGNRGIGLGVVKELSEKGMNVILGSRSRESGEAAWKSIGSPENVIVEQLDVTNESSIDSLRSSVEGRFGKLDILVNNAGINYDTWQTALDADLDNVQETLATNLTAPWKMIKAFTPLMKKSGQGRIVNVSSGAGSLNDMSGGTPGYSISKAALNVLTIKLSSELSSDGILINSVCPGWVRTDMGGSNASRSIEQGASGVVWAALIPGGGPTGKFFRDGKEIPW